MKDEFDKNVVVINCDNLEYVQKEIGSLNHISGFYNPEQTAKVFEDVLISREMRGFCSRYDKCFENIPNMDMTVAALSSHLFGVCNSNHVSQENALDLAAILVSSCVFARFVKAMNEEDKDKDKVLKSMVELAKKVPKEDKLEFFETAHKYKFIDNLLEVGHPTNVAAYLSATLGAATDTQIRDALKDIGILDNVLWNGDRPNRIAEISDVSEESLERQGLS